MALLDGAPIESLYQSAMTLKYEAEEQLQRLTQAGSQFDDASLNAASSCLNRLAAQAEALEQALARQMRDRDKWRPRVLQLGQDTKTLRYTLERFLKRQQQQSRADEDRRALFSGVSSIAIDIAVQESESLSRSHRMADESIQVAHATLFSLGQQRETLKKAHRFALQMMNTLGLSNQAMRVIQGRTSGDRALVYAGMVVVCILLYFAYRYVRG